MGKSQANFEKIIYSEQNHLLWNKLHTNQLNNLKDKACAIFLENLEKFSLPINRIPSLSEISQKLQNATHWELYPVNGLIGYIEYFKLLSMRKFPCATFIRDESNHGLSKDPDIFHEVFGHCTMLLSPKYAKFMEKFAKFALAVQEKDRPLFARLTWFTTETGLISSKNGLKIYGSSLLSSLDESRYCLESKEPIIKKFNLIDIFREPYRADILQKVYYVIEDLDEVYNLLDDTDKLYQCLYLAKKLGEFKPRFPVENTKYCNVGHCFEET